MDMIEECGKNFSNLLNVMYIFTISKNRKSEKIIVDFKEEDFFHLAGFQHLDDIEIPQNRKTTLKLITKKIITDEHLKKSKKFTNANKKELDIASRISELRYLEQYLDTNNMIRIFDMSSSKEASNMEADYFIESKFTKRTVYIFIKKRKETLDTYCLNSFFVKTKTYYGINVYWMLKEKVINGVSAILYKNKSYEPK